jgi:hypothetical protein
MLAANNLSELTNKPLALANLGGAPLASPVFTGDARAVTPSTSDSDTSIATTAFVQAAITAALTAGGGIPSGTLMLFQQTAAPTGWTKQTTHNDKALRVVSGTASSGGSNQFSTQFGTINTAIHVVTVPEMTSHGHTTNPATAGVIDINTGGPNNVAAGAQAYAGLGINAAGGSAGHIHTVNLGVMYVDLIIASKN